MAIPCNEEPSIDLCKTMWLQVFHLLLSPPLYPPSAQIHLPRKQPPPTVYIIHNGRKTGCRRIEDSARIIVLRQRMKKHLRSSSDHLSLGVELSTINDQTETEMRIYRKCVDLKSLKCLLRQTGSLIFALQCWCQAVIFHRKFRLDSWYFRPRLLNLFLQREVLLREVLQGTLVPTKELVLVI